MSLAAPTRLGPYEVLGLIGAGGMGEVYRARDTRLDRTVAIKILPSDISADPDRRARFEREAKSIAALAHPHICTLYDVGEDAGAMFLVMEHLEGETLAHRLEKGPLSIEQALTIGIQIAEALSAAHRHGIVHRDLKPGNVMLTDTGPKLLDFGVARSFTASGADAPTRSAAVTIAGTPAYMAPEQWDGRDVDARADIWALGVVLFEMLIGRHPFFSDAARVTPFTAVPESAPRLRAARPDAPVSLARVLDRALQRDAAERYGSTAEMLQDLTVCRQEIERAQQPASWRQALAALRRPWVAAVVLVVAGSVAVVSAWWLHRAATVRTARDRVVEIARLAEQDRVMEAYLLARQLDEVIPSDAALTEAWKSISLEGTIESRPAGVDVFIQPYLDVSGPWIHLGRTPITGAKLPNRGLLRVRAEAPGWQTLVAARTAPMLLRMVRQSARSSADLEPAGIDLTGAGAPERMIRIPSARKYTPVMFHGFPTPPQVDLPEYWLDAFEVTNADFKKFVDAGGYERQDYWPQPIRKDGHVLAFREALRAFVDKTGRPGPAPWELGTFPPGSGELPVSGVSWYEAAAYAAYAGKQLPTLYHWIRAASVNQAHEMLPLSNVGSAGRRAGGPVRVGTMAGVTTWGAFDMAGNVKEWCANEAEGGTRVILGGGWDEPDYMFYTSDARDPMLREQNMGFRCARYPRQETSPQAMSWVPRLPRSYEGLHPVNDNVFALYREMYAYDRTPLDVKTERASGDDNPAWRWEKVSYAPAGVSEERIPAYVMLPRQSAPPYQALVFFPGSTATALRSSDTVPERPDVDWVVRSGRAIIVPIYKGTFERGNAASWLGHMPAATAASRDLRIQLAREVQRSVDYLESRADIDPTRIAYYGLSWGAAVAPLPLALERRFRTAVLVSGGLLWMHVRPEVDAVNFLPRVRIPVLMLNGAHDAFYTPPSQQAFFDLLGTPAAQKQHVVYADAGHAVPRNAGIAATLQWLDAQLGEVKRK